MISKKKAENSGDFILNCIESQQPEDDWTFQDAREAELVNSNLDIPDSHDLRTYWWPVDNQEDSGAGIGYATARGVLRWHYVQKGLITKTEVPSAQFIWMANKEIDNNNRYPITFFEDAGIQTKTALKLVHKYGCVLEEDLPLKSKMLSRISIKAFYIKATKLRIRSFFNLGKNLDHWRYWLAHIGPLLTRLEVDDTWKNASLTNGYLKEYNRQSASGGHAVCLIGYTKDYFIVRNSWGEIWGDDGFAYASSDYASHAFTEMYGILI